MTTTSTTTGTAQRQQPNVDTSLETTLRKFTEAFNRRDAREVGSFWAEDGTVINPTGTQGIGPAGVGRVFQGDTEAILRGTTSKFTITGARKIGSETMLLDLDQEVQNFKMPDGSTGTRTLHVVMLARKKGDGWQFLDVRPYAFVEVPKRLH